MTQMLNQVTPIEWVLFGMALLALLLAALAYLKAGRALRSTLRSPQAAIIATRAEPELEQEQRPEVAVELSAEKDDEDQVTLTIRNLGTLPARQINLLIDKPERVFNAEGLGGGLAEADVTANAAILPRLIILDAENVLPVSELTTDRRIALPAALTMAYGKICDFPVTLNWRDGKGKAHKKRMTLTI